MNKILKNSNKENSLIRRIAIGSSVSILITLICLTIFAFLLTYTSISEGCIPTITIIITIISILIGSSFSMYGIRKNGIGKGAMLGYIYILTIYMLSSLIEKDFSVNTYSIIMIVGSILAGALGGIVGVNRK